MKQPGRKLLIEPHLLGSLEYFTVILQFDEVIWEIQDHFIKQTYRNRYRIAGPNGLQTLSVPVNYGNRTKYMEVRIDYAQSWVKDHLGALKAAYAKSPFFEFVYPEISQVLARKPKFLVDLSHEMMTICQNFLQVDIDIKVTSAYHIEVEKGTYDLRNSISSKIPFEKRAFYQSVPYHQNFGNNFAANLSVIDCLFNMGTTAFDLVNQSTKEW